MTPNTFREFADHLRRISPIGRKLVIRRIAMKDHGCTSLSDSEQTITVSVRQADSLSVQLDTLIHEWGHVLEIDLHGDHGPRWARGAGAAYRAWLEWSNFTERSK